MAEGMLAVAELPRRGGAADGLISGVQVCQGDLTAKVQNRSMGLAIASARIAAERPSSSEIAFVHSVLCQIGLPRSQVNGERFERKSGKAVLVLRAGELWDGSRMVRQPVPYGYVPRLILAYLTRYAVRYRTREIPFGESANDALRNLAIRKGGRSYAMFRKQVLALAACSITLGFNDGVLARTVAGSPIERFDAWTVDQYGRQGIWPANITLGSRFYESLIDRSVPYDFRALAALRGSTLAMDVYLWLASRLVRVRGPSVPVAWVPIKAQFGGEYADMRNFKRKFLPALEAALIVYPSAKVDVHAGGLQLYRSPPAVPRRA